jgi:hypothetical protein
VDREKKEKSKGTERANIEQEPSLIIIRINCSLVALGYMRLGSFRGRHVEFVQIMIGLDR